jgi:probable F420-dependent oxidoreductase
MVRPFRFSVTSKTAEPGAFVEEARRAEDLGYSTLAIADHLGSQFAPMVGLMAAADATTSLRLMTLVLSNDYRHPVLVAKEAATLDQLSGGRLELGIGAGWMRSDYDAAGLRLDGAGTRIERLAEAVAVLKGLFANETFSFAGNHYNISEMTGTPSPHQHPHPPLLLAGGGRKVLGLAGREADIVGVNPGLGAGVIDNRVGVSATPSATDEKVAWLRESAGDRFDSIELHTRVHLAAISHDRDGLAEALAPGLGLTPEEALDTPHALFGSVAECIESVTKWRERWGISYIGLSIDAMDAMAPVVAALAGK